MPSDNFVIKFPPHQSLVTIEHEVRHVAAVDPRSLRPKVNESARDAPKFAECLPIALADRVIQERLIDPTAVAGTLANSTRVVIADQASGVTGAPETVWLLGPIYSDRRVRASRLLRAAPA